MIYIYSMVGVKGKVGLLWVYSRMKELVSRLWLCKDGMAGMKDGISFPACLNGR